MFLVIMLSNQSSTVLGNRRSGHFVSNVHTRALIRCTGNKKNNAMSPFNLFISLRILFSEAVNYAKYFRLVQKVEYFLKMIN